MFYFSEFPRVVYDVTGTNAPQLAMDITRGVKITEELRARSMVYYEYNIKDSDRPYVLAERYYENSNLDWIFFLTNYITDPYYSWPMNYTEFLSYIRKKYGNVDAVQNTTHSYEQIITPRQEFYSNYDGSTIVIPEKTVVVDFTTYSSLPVSQRKLISVFDAESRANDAKRNIRILDKQYVPGLLRTVRRIFTE